MDSLTTAVITPNKLEKIEAIRKVCQQGKMNRVKPTKIDLKIISHKGSIYLFDIKIAKPNASGFQKFKRTLLEWVAATLAINPDADIHTPIQIEASEKLFSAKKSSSFSL